MFQLTYFVSDLSNIISGLFGQIKIDNKILKHAKKIFFQLKQNNIIGNDNKKILKKLYIME